MATTTGPDSPRELPRLRVSSEEAEQLVERQLLRGRAIRDGEIESQGALREARGASSRWCDFTRDLLLKILSTDEAATQFASSTGPFVSWGSPTFPEELSDFRGEMDTRVRRVESVRERLELFEEPPTPTPSSASSLAHSTKHVQTGASSHPLFRKVLIGGTAGDTPPDTKPAVFVVHGRDLKAVDQVVRLLEKLGLRPVVLREQPNKGRTVIEKFEAYSDVVYAVVLLTPDDVGSLASDWPDGRRDRARQNVLLELGFFIGRLGRDKVCALEPAGVERPSDVEGIIYIRFDATDSWRLDLAREMQAAGLPVDLNHLL